MKKDKFSQVEEFLKKNQIQEALRLCKSICRKERNHFDAWATLGMLCGQLGNYSDAENSFSHLVRIKPKFSNGYFNLAKAQEAMAKWEEAEKNYESAIELNPHFAQAYNSLSAIKVNLDKLDEAEACLLKAIEINPAYPIPYRNIGVLHQRQNRLEDAEKAYLKALELKPDFLNAASALADIMLKTSRNDEAKNYLFYALKIQPDNPALHTNLANYYMTNSQLEEADKHFNIALSKQPDYFFALSGLGLTMQKVGDYESAEKLYQQALGQQPDDYNLLNNFALVQIAKGNCFRAKEIFERIIKNYDDIDTGIYESYATALFDSGEIVKAEQQLNKALDMEPENSGVHVKLGNVLKSQGKIKEADQVLKKALELNPDDIEVMNPRLITMSLHNIYSREEKFFAHLEWGTTLESKYFANIKFNNVRNKERKLRIAYISSDFQNNSLSFCVVPIVLNTDREKYEVYFYSDLSSPSETTKKIKESVDHWRPCNGIENSDVSTMILKDGIDILVDLSDHALNSRIELFAKRVAPVQVSYLGYPNTSGLILIDYLLSDELCDPTLESDQFYTETLVRIPDSFSCYEPPPISVEIGELPSIENKVITFASFSDLSKINEDVIELWCRVLYSVPDSKMLIECFALKDKAVVENVARCFHSYGIVSERLILRGASDFSGYLNSHNQVDIVLDPFPWGEHVKTYHSLWMGVPVITLVGEGQASRRSYSILQNLGLSECIAFDKDEYVEKAVSLAGNLVWLEEMRKFLREELLGSQICNGRNFTNKLEEQYSKMWNKWCDEQDELEKISEQVES